MTDEEKTHEGKKSRSRKQKRRGKGEGSIYPDKKNDRWVGSFFSGDGKRIYVYARTQEEAREKLRTAQHADKQGSLVTGPQQTVKQFLEYWLEEIHKPAIRISSYVLYRGMLDNHILPELGQVKLRQLTVGHVESFYAKKAREGLSASTIKVMHGVLHSALSHAVYVNLVVRNVSAIAKKSLPRQTRYEIQPLTKEQAHMLLEQARGEKSEALLILALTTGMRRGELVALRWSDIHFEETYLQIRRSARTDCSWVWIANHRTENQVQSAENCPLTSGHRDINTASSASGRGQEKLQQMHGKHMILCSAADMGSTWTPIR